MMMMAARTEFTIEEVAALIGVSSNTFPADSVLALKDIPRPIADVVRLATGKPKTCDFSDFKKLAALKITADQVVALAGL